MDITRQENAEVRDDMAAMELMQYTRERLPHYEWLFAGPAMRSDPGPTHGEG